MSSTSLSGDLPDLDPEPDIVITDEDLDALGQQTQIIDDFFADPRPKPVASTALVESKCVKTGKTYYLLFEQIGPGAWAIRAALDDAPSVGGMRATRASIQSNMVSGSIDWSDLWVGKARCPHCSALAFFKCGCNRLSCHIDGQQGSTSICAWCGRQGVLRGGIKSLDGRQGKGKERKT